MGGKKGKSTQLLWRESCFVVPQTQNSAAALCFIGEFKRIWQNLSNGASLLFWESGKFWGGRIVTVSPLKPCTCFSLVEGTTPSQDQCATFSTALLCFWIKPRSGGSKKGQRPSCNVKGSCKRSRCWWEDWKKLLRAWDKMAEPRGWEILPLSLFLWN